MRKWMTEFLRKFENRSTKISRVNLILITKSINLHLFTLILYGFSVRCDLRRFSMLSPFIQTSMSHYNKYFRSIHFNAKYLITCVNFKIFQFRIQN